MITIHVQAASHTKQATQLVQSAVSAEIARLELALEMARKRLTPFERKYDVTSGHFYAEMAAEDLDGGDDEYVCWAGEFKLWQRLQDKLGQLREIRYVD
jgi:hypothetical protein